VKLLTSPESNQIKVLAATDAWLHRNLNPAKILNVKEQARADRFVVETARTQFAFARAFLRTALGHALNIPAEDVTFGTGPHGKPFLAGQPSQSGLQFNLSHCSGLTLFAATLDSSVGVDVEQPDRSIDRHRFAQRFFHRLELERLSGLSPKEHRDVFFRIWTQKEAWLKALGVGLDLPLSSFAVTGEQGEAAALTCWDSDASAAEKWRLHSLELQGYPVTICSESNTWSLETELLL
jgi:4'-phosphopantetheinyl transferase